MKTQTHQERVLRAFKEPNKAFELRDLFARMRITKLQHPYYTGVINKLVSTGALVKHPGTGKLHKARQRPLARPDLMPAPAQTAFRPVAVVTRTAPETVEEFLARGGKIKRIKGIEQFIPDIKRTP